MNNLISVIVPVYNAEKYLYECLESIRKQTYKNIEILLINDGSTDNSAQICNEFSKKYKEFKTYHQKNNGVSRARNIGMENAKGDFIIFIDSDDTIAENYIEVLYKNIIEYDADISMCNIIRVDESGKYIEDFDNTRKKEKIQTILMNQNEYISNILDYKYYYTYATNKLIKRDIIKNIRFREDIHYNEDGIFFLDLSKNITTAVFTYPIYAYFYLQNTTSANAQRFNEKYLTVIKAFEIMEQYFKIFKKNNKNYFSYRYINYYIEAYYYQHINKKSTKKDKKKLKKVINKYWKYAIKSDNISVTKRIKLILKIIFPITTMKLKYRKVKVNEK